LPLDLRIDHKSSLKKGDVVQILDEYGKISDYAYLTSDVKISYGVATFTATLQKINRNIEMVMTDAIRKV
jgi:hypothetical protein